MHSHCTHVVSHIQELESYHRGLCEWPSVLVVNKMDKAGAEQGLRRLVRKLSSSCHTGTYHSKSIAGCNVT